MNTTAPEPSTPAEPARPRSPRGQGERLRAEILEAVARLLDERVRHPDLALSLREVARETGIATQSMYLHFPSKEALAWAAAADGYQRLVAAMREAADRTEGDAADRLRAQGHAFWEFSLANRGVIRLMFGHDVSRLDPDKPEHPGAVLWYQWLDAVHACEAEGRDFPGGAEMAAISLWSALLGRFALWSTTFGHTDPASMRAFTDHTIDRILTE